MPNPKSPRGTRFQNEDGELSAVLQVSDNQADAVQTQMAVSGPAAADAKFPHGGNPVRIGQGEVLVSELLHYEARLHQFGGVKALDSQARQGVNEGQELNYPVSIIPAEEPPMPLCDNYDDVISGGGVENRRRNNAWKLSDRSRKAMKAEVST
jgi:hypothetical protein